MAGDEFVGPGVFLGLEKEFEVVRGEHRLLVEQGEQSVVVLDAMDRVVLRNGAVHELAIEEPVAFVLVAEADVGADEAGDGAVVDAAERMDVDGDVVALAAKFHQEGERVERAVLDEVLLVNGVEVRVAFEDVPGPRPEHEGVDGGVRIVRAELVDEGRGDQGVANAREGEDKYSGLTAVSRSGHGLSFRFLRHE